jgi:monoamine oxidase
MTPTSHTPPSIMVIGAGLSGLTAAHLMDSHGFAVTVIEARDRVGGRAASSTEGLADGQHCDLGGELIFSGYRALISLCQALGVTLSEEVWFERQDAEPSDTPLEAYLSRERILVDGRFLAGDEFASVDAEIRAAVRATAPSPHETLAQWLNRARLSSAAKATVLAVSRMAVQSDPYQVDTHYLLQSRTGPVRRIVGGTQQLANALSAGLEVRLNAPVRTIRQVRNGVEVELESGERLAADRAVVTIPSLVLPTIGFEPPLEHARLGALTSLQRSSGGKVIGQYAEGEEVRASLSRAMFTDGPINTVWVSNPFVKDGPAVVTGLIAGTQRSLLENEESALVALDSVVSVAVGTHVARIGSHLKNWTTDPYALGMGAMPRAEQAHALATLLATPLGRLHFAGDNTEPQLCGTLEAAVRSGVRVANDVFRLGVRMMPAEITEELVEA